MDQKLIEIHRIVNIHPKKPTIILGFPGTGLVGSVAAAHLVDVLKAEFVGYISSPEFAPLASIHNYTPLPAARIHYSKKHNIVIFLSEMSVPIKVSGDLAEEILKFARSFNAERIISLGGISLGEDESDIYIVSSDKKLIKSIVDRKIAKPIREGATTGIIGILLAKGSLQRLSVLSILAESSEDYLDPKAASNSLRTLAKILDIDINTAELDSEAREIAGEMKEKIVKSKIAKAEFGASSMYG